VNACPNWTDLVAHRYARAEQEPRGWGDALAHAEACARCRQEAIAADPTLVFRRLATAGTPREARDVDVAAMRQAVATLRRARALEPARQSNRWRWAAAAVLPLLALLLPSAQDPSRSRAVGDSSLTLRLPTSMLPSAELAALPLLDDLDRPHARVYELGGPDLAVVMIVDETLDV
jgi:hypothetical protein